jgi:hypothetical protein
MFQLARLSLATYVCWKLRDGRTGVETITVEIIRICQRDDVTSPGSGFKICLFS